MISKIKFKGDLSMKKRIVSIMLVMCLLSLVACQNGASDSNVESISEVQTGQETLLSRDKSVYPDDITVEMLKRTPNKYIDKEFKLTGNIVAELKYDGEVEDKDGNTHTGEESSEYIACYYLAVNGNNDDTVVLTYYRDDFDYNLLVGDNVTMYGTLLEGGMEFKKTNGTITTIPAVIAVMIDLNN